MQALKFHKATFLLAAFLAVGGCGGGSGDVAGESPGGWPGNPGVLPGGPGGDSGNDTGAGHQVSGSVGDGPVIAAELAVVSSSGILLAQMSSSSTADYGLTLLAEANDYPLSIVAEGGTDLVTGGPLDFQLVSAVLEPATETISNLNPFTTLIQGAARHSGELSRDSLAASQVAIMASYSFGLDADAVPDPAGTPIGNDNVHHIVKASEALGEMIRRTRDAMTAAGISLDGDDIVASLSADLVDGFIDGRGATGSDARIAAVANVASAAVLLESMANRLRVYGVDATRAMDRAIDQVRPHASEEAQTANVPITSAVLAQARQSLRAVAAITPDPRIDAAQDALAQAVPGTVPAEFSALLPEGIGELMATAILETARASDAQLAIINAIGRGQEPPTEDVAGRNWATVSWRPPTENTDRSPVERINHYTLYYGRNADQLNRQIRIGGGQTRFQVRDLTPGTWYFAVTATARGIESAKSNVRSKTIS